MNRNRKSTRPCLNASGFTIIELMLAMTVFSLVLVAASVGLIQIGRMYYRGVITTRTQDNTRLVIDEISRSIQFTGGDILFSNNPDEDHRAVCIGSTRYSYVINQQLLNDTPHVLWRDQPNDLSSCNPVDLLSSDLENGTELAGENMRLSRFSVEKRDNEYVIRVGLVYGDYDLLVGVRADGEYVDYDDDSAERIICGIGASTQFCAVSNLETVVISRLSR
ncbi:hypothetical protein BH23PAT2_BH23PAT2_03210 [soil metagenome]